MAIGDPLVGVSLWGDWLEELMADLLGPPVWFEVVAVREGEALTPQPQVV